MSTYWGGGLKPPGLTSKSDSFDQVTEIITNDQPQLLPAKLGTPMNEQHLVHPCIHEAMYASLSRWMGDAVGPLISTKIFSWDKDGAAPTRVEYSDFAKQFELKPGDKFKKMLDDVYMLHRLSELSTRPADSKIKEKEYSVSSKLAKLISDADLKLEAKLAGIETQCAPLRTPIESVDGVGVDAHRPRNQVSSPETLLLSYPASMSARRRQDASTSRRWTRRRSTSRVLSRPAWPRSTARRRSHLISSSRRPSLARWKS